ncbi:MAG TPA: alpha-ketoacid dehydrogenase subunit beta [Chloroflexia bacterium]|nr:alpha-ketoacid dehydrogenase subunit beta [Chloroflexia bacterium]
MTVEVGLRTISVAEAINEAMRLEMRRDPRVILMGEDVAGGANLPHLEDDEAWGGVLGVTKGLVQEFGRERIRDTPISESAFIGAAVGAAATGLHPIAELMFCGFIGSCMDSLLNQGSKLRYMFGGKASVPVTIRTMVGGGFRAAAQHAQSLYPMFASIPGLKVVAPSNPADAKGLLTAAIRDNDPVIFCEHIAMYTMTGPVPEGEYVVPLGKANITRHGKDVTIVGVSMTARHALAAAEILAREGIDAEVLDLRTVSPLDEDAILDSVAKTGKLVVADESNPFCGLASHIAGLAASKGFQSLRAPVQLVTAPHAPVPFSPPLEDAYLPNPDKIATAVRSICR